MEKLEPGPHLLCLSWACGVFPGAQFPVAHHVWLWEPPCLAQCVEMAGVASPSLRAWRGPSAPARPGAEAVSVQAELWACWAWYLPAQGPRGSSIWQLCHLLMFLGAGPWGCTCELQPALFCQVLSTLGGLQNAEPPPELALREQLLVLSPGSPHLGS